jgi:hypothetical protein
MSFGLIMSFAILLMAAAVSTYRQSPLVFGGGLLLAIGSALSAILWPWIWSLPYKAWNKAARHYGEFARGYALRMCYLVIASVGMAPASSSFSRTRRSGTVWEPRRSSTDTGKVIRKNAKTQNSGHQSWVRSFISWATGSRQTWALALLPFFLVLSFLEMDEESVPSDKTYTLF